MATVHDILIESNPDPEETSSLVVTDDEMQYGAPVEKYNPLGHEVTLLSAVMLNFGQLLGSGIYSVPGIMLNEVGSVGLLIVFWLIAPVFAASGLMVYGEMAGFFPDRSGAEAVYLEQAYPNPRYMVPVTFAVSSVLLSYSATNAIILVQYAFTMFGVTITPERQTYGALVVATFAVMIVGLSTKWALRMVNFFSFFKVLSLVFVVITGIAVLLGFTRIHDPLENFAHPFQGSNWNVNALATALVKSNFAYIGYANAFQVTGEVRGKSPARTVRTAGAITIASCAVLFTLANVAYVAAVPKETFSHSGELIAALFFKNVFGDNVAAKLLPALVSLSCFGNIIAVTYGKARLIREIARQGLLPYASFFASTEPFGTPLGSVLLIYLFSCSVIVGLPAKEAFEFLVNVAGYPQAIFHAAMALGIYNIRNRRRKQGLPASPLRSPDTIIALYLAISLFLIIMPWVPPREGHQESSFWYATYCIVGLGILGACGLYYYVWMVFLPRWGGYEIYEEVDELPNGGRVTHFVRRYKSEASTLGSRIGEHQALLGSSS